MKGIFILLRKLLKFSVIYGDYKTRRKKFINGIQPTKEFPQGTNIPRQNMPIIGAAIIPWIA